MTETERLHIYPASREQMEALIAAEQDAELKKAYTEMLEGCIRHPDQWEWYAAWMIEKKDGTPVGDLCFKGLSENGTAEIGYGILTEYQGRGYATEAVQAVCRWAFRHLEVKALEAETAPENAASQRVLAKCGFRPNGSFGEEGPRFTLSRARGEELDRVIAYIRTKPFGDSDRVALTCGKGNPTARKLYEKKGFSATGVEDEDEIELVLEGKK